MLQKGMNTEEKLNASCSFFVRNNTLPPPGINLHATKATSFILKYYWWRFKFGTQFKQSWFNNTEPEMFAAYLDCNLVSSWKEDNTLLIVLEDLFHRQRVSNIEKWVFGLLSVSQEYSFNRYVLYLQLKTLLYGILLHIFQIYLQLNVFMLHMIL
jgi:hypothetical protein